MTLLGNPNLALLLLLAGIFLIYAECNRPGIVLLGSSGTFAVLLGIYSLAQHHINPTALPVLVVGISLTLLELRASTRNVLAVIGTAAIVLALATLTQPPIHPVVAFATGTLFTLVTLPLARIALRARRNKRTFPQPAPNLQPSVRPSAE